MRRELDDTAILQRTPAIGDLLERARALVPGIAARRAEAEVRRDIPEATIAAMKAAGLLRVYQPARWGGLECDPRDVYDIQNLFAETCLSTGWVYGVLALQSFFLARFGEQAQADVWGKNPDALLSSSFAPLGKVTRVEGGFRVSGRYGYSSGSSHADWAVVGGIVAPDGEGDVPHLRLFLIPRADYVIDDMWHTIGLRGTGSNDLVIADAFVPDHRVYRPDPGLVPLPPESNLAPLHRLPWVHMASATIGNVAIGGTRAALRAFADATRARRAAPPPPGVPENPALLSVIARAEAEADATGAVSRRNIGRYFSAIAENRAMEPAEALTYRVQITGSLRRLTALVDEMVLLSGGHAIREGSPLTRIWLDLIAARAHFGNDPAGAMAMLGSTLDAGFAQETV
jgi:3-hydroxy-9,10-secoandrosta-1,3,5(10)-triene-9,17-dione monooxygenase